MPRPATRDTAQRPAVLRRFRGNADGAAAVEFALVALPFLGLVGAILQVAFQIWAGQNFDWAVQNGVRGILTGQFQQANAGATTADALKALKAAICGPTSATTVNVFNCQSIKIDVSTFSSFGGSSASAPLDKTTGTWTSNFGTGYAPPGDCTITVVTAAAAFPSFFSLLGLNMKRFTSGTESGSGLLTSTAVFRTEPYSPTRSSGC